MKVKVSLHDESGAEVKSAEVPFHHLETVGAILDEGKVYVFYPMNGVNIKPEFQEVYATEWSHVLKTNEELEAEDNAPDK